MDTQLWNSQIFMMNNLQKDLQENVEKYNGKHHLHKRIKVINCYYCYPISTEANVPDNFIRFWDWISIFHSAKSCTSLTLFYFERVIKARARRNRNAIIPYKKLGYVFYTFCIRFIYVFKKSTVFIRNWSIFRINYTFLILRFL